MSGPDGTTILMLGEDFGWVTAYLVPEFEPLGKFYVGQANEPASRIRAICDCGNREMFVVGTESGDLQVFRWLPSIRSEAGSGAVAVSGIAAGAAAATDVNPFTGARLGGGLGGGGGGNDME